MPTEKKLTGYPSIDKPWLKYYTKEAINADLPEGSMFDFLYNSNKEHPREIALKYYGTNITYSTLFENIELTMQSFTKLGVKKNDIVLFFTVSMPEVIYSIYGLNKIGAVCNFINALSSAKEVHNYLLECGSEVMVCLDLFVGKVMTAIEGTKVKKVVVMSLANSMPVIKSILFKSKIKSKLTDYKCNDKFISWKSFVVHETTDREQIKCGNSDDIAIVGHTGGTTGFPKSVLLTNKAINSIAFQYLKAYKYERQQVALDIIVPQSVYGISINIHMPLCLGMSLAIIPKFDGGDWSKYIKWYKPNHIAAAPPHIIPFMSFPKIDLSSFITIAYGGDVLSESMEKSLNEFLESHGCKAKLTQGYGLSETGAAAFMTYNYCNKPQSVGVPLPKNTVMIWDQEDQKECTYGVVGEICINGPGVMKEYANKPEETEKMLQKHIDGTVWLHTGDLGYLDEDGFLFIDGRIKRIILSYKDGVCGKIYPDRIEKQLSDMEEVKFVCIVGVPDQSRGMVANAYVVINDNFVDREHIIEKKLVTYCTKELPEYAQPVKYIFRESLPLTPIGKVDYRALEKEAETL